jgi:hypothetical protein
LNSRRPLTDGGWSEADPICPAGLLLGRATAHILSTQFETGRSLVKRLRLICTRGQVGEGSIPSNTETDKMN